MVKAKGLEGAELMRSSRMAVNVKSETFSRFSSIGQNWAKILSLNFELLVEFKL